MQPLSTRQHIGLGLAGLLSALSVPDVFTPTPAGTVGPPLAVLVLTSALGLIGVIAVVLAWRGNAAAQRVAAGAVILLMLAAVPAFFVDVPAVVRVIVAASVLVTVASVVLMLSAAHRPVPVMD